jgi:hypothetical protein
MRSIVRLALALVLGSSLAGATSAAAHAMGSGNPFEDLQVGVTYTVYQPDYTGGLVLSKTGSNAACPAGTEQNMIADYGSPRKTRLELTEGNPLCSDPGGAGKPVGSVAVLGAKAAVQAYCDPTNAKQWKACTKADIARYGGSVYVTLPGYGKLRPTVMELVTYGSKPLSYAQLIRVAKSMKPVAGNQQLVGGMATCTQADFGDVIAAGLPKGEVLVSVDGFACDSGWAYAFATVGDGKGHNTTVTYVFEAEGQFWIPKDGDKVCGTKDAAHPDQRPSDSQVPAAIWTSACNTN